MLVDERIGGLSRILKSNPESVIHNHTLISHSMIFLFYAVVVILIMVVKITIIKPTKHDHAIHRSPGERDADGGDKESFEGEDSLSLDSAVFMRDAISW